jgi:hypothetical protein
MIDVRVLDIQPHPDQATNNPGCWAVRFEVSCDRTTRTFWRWHTERKSDKKPKAGDLVKRFWDDTFGELHGFSFNKDAP